MMKKDIISQNIKNVRLKRGETQTEFGKKLNATRSNVSKWELGKNLPSKKRLKKIANIGNISVDELLGNNTVIISKDEYDNLLEIAEKYEKSNNNSTGQRIRKIRESFNETMEEFGKKHFDPPASKGIVSNWENGYNKPNKKRLDIIAEIGDITVDELLGNNTVTISKDEYDKFLKDKENINTILETLK